MSEDKSSALYDDIVTVNSVDPALYDMYPVKRGLRNNDGSGVIAGITNISNVHGYMMNEGDKVPVEGKLTFRGYDIYDLLSDTSPEKRYGFEEVAYLLMLGKLPTQDELDQFVAAIDAERELPDGFTAARIMRHPAADLMIMLSRSIISLYAMIPMPRIAPSSTRSKRLFRSSLVCSASWCSLTMRSRRISTAIR